MKTIFLGTPNFGAIILEGLIKSGNKPFLVITEADKPVGRKQIMTPPPVKVLAEKYDIPVAQPDKISNWKSEIENLKPDLGIIAAYGQILPKGILDIPQYGFINVHPSLLPKYRGPSPIQAAILNGDENTGVTIMRISEKMDSGPILSQKEMEINQGETFLSLHAKLAKVGSELLLNILPKLSKGQAYFENQEENKATYTKILKREDGKIDWQLPAKNIERQIRAFDPWPGVYTMWNNLKIKIKKARLFHNPDGAKYPVGKVLVVPDNEIGIQCGDGDFLAIETLQLEGKKEVKAEDFLRGHDDFIGAILK